MLGVLATFSYKFKSIEALKHGEQSLRSLGYVRFNYCGKKIIIDSDLCKPKYIDSSS